MHLRLLASDNGAPFPLLRALEAMSTLESDLLGSGIRVALASPIDTIVDGAFNQHADVLAGADFMFDYNRPGGLNAYLLSNPAGNCGYNLPYAGVAVARQCANLGEHTFAHEVGHALSIPHPFLGWEGGQGYDGDTPADFTSPAPRRVTYDYTYFQDTLIRDTLIVDTALVELVDRSNCREAADGFCDTAPDYVASRWTCDANGESVRQLDPDSVAFRSDGSLIMSYSDDACQARFTPEQQAAMRAFLLDQRADWILTGVDTARVLTTVENLVPDGGTLAADFVLPFSAPANADRYYVTVSARRSLRSPIVDVVTRTPSVQLDPADFDAGEEYYYRVYPFNDHSFGAGVSGTYRFVAPLASGSTGSTVESAGLSLHPNPVSPGAEVTIAGAAAGTRVEFYAAATGRRAGAATIRANRTATLPAGMPTGVYVVRAVSPSRRSQRLGRLAVR